MKDLIISLIKNFIYINFYKLIILKNKFIANFFLIDIYYKNKFSFLNKKFIDNNVKKNIKKKIILITGPLSFGGSEVQIIKLAYHLKKLKYNVKVASLIYGKYQKYKIPKSFKVDYIKTHNSNSKIEKNYLSKHKLNLFVKGFLKPYEKLHLFKLYDYLKKEKPDIVHAHLDFYCIITGILAVYLKINKAILSTRSEPVYNFTFYRGYYKAAFQALYKFKSIQFTNNCKANSSSYDKWLKFPRGTFKTTYNIFDFNKKDKIKKIKITATKNSIKIGSVLRLDPEKNPIYLIKLMKYLITKNPNYIFYIIGNGFMQKKIKKYILRNNLKNKIILINNKDNIIDYLRYFDVFLLASKHEGTPNVILESQSVGTPVISTNVGGVRECIYSPYSGNFISGTSYKKDGEIIIRTLKKKNFLKKKNVKIIKKKLSKFLPKNSVEQVLKIYDRRIK
jgi:glycosyltransferase involved in cell wall biosynthesis